MTKARSSAGGPSRNPCFRAQEGRNQCTCVCSPEYPPPPNCRIRRGHARQLGQRNQLRETYVLPAADLIDAGHAGATLHDGAKVLVHLRGRPHLVRVPVGLGEHHFAGVRNCLREGEGGGSDMGMRHTPKSSRYMAAEHKQHHAFPAILSLVYVPLGGCALSGVVRRAWKQAVAHTARAGLIGDVFGRRAAVAARGQHNGQANNAANHCGGTIARGGRCDLWR